jgi:hypothetical protein
MHYVYNNQMHPRPFSAPILHPLLGSEPEHIIIVHLV